ncbi:hypothetical protein [Sphingomonas sp.]|uniref:hypothetical protein n=1 Tax=Sphingomonas sp. TaxID=28214 RepID=UPI00307E4CDE
MRNVIDLMPDGAKHAIDLISIVSLLGALVSILPKIATILTIIWTLLRIWQEPIVQRLFTRRKPDA